MTGILERHRGAVTELMRFGSVGVLGFCLDVGCVYALKARIGLYAAGTAAYLVAASANWALNRLWTFRHSVHDAFHAQWARFLVVNMAGFVLNRGAYSLLIADSLVARRQPIIAVAAGAAAGFAVNFLLSRRFVFRSGRAEAGQSMA